MCRNALEDPWEEAREDMYTRSVSPEQAPDKATYIDLEFEGGNPVAIDGQQLSPASLLTQLNKVRKKRGKRKKSMPFGIHVMRSQVLHRAAQAQQGDTCCFDLPVSSHSSTW